MAQLYLSNRLRDLYGAAGRFGDTVADTRQLRRQNARQAESDRMAGEQHALATKEGGLRLKALETSQARAAEMQGMEDQLSQLEAGTFQGPAGAGDFQAGMADPWAPMKDRIRASMARARGEDLTAEDLKQGREGKALGKLELSRKATREQEAHESAMATDKTQRALYDAQAERQRADAARAGQPVPKPPRDLSDSGIKAIAEQGTKLINVHGIVDSFKPEFTGQLTGGLSNKIGKVTGGNVVGASPEQVGWWENYQGFVNQVRNELFGAALTPGEKAEFEKTVVKPNTSSEVAKANLLRQWEIVKAATERNANTYAAGNVNRDQISAALGGNYDPESGKIGLGISWDKRGTNRGAGGSWDAPPAASGAAPDRRSLAEQALNDPDATPAEKAQARRILGL